MKRRRWLQWGCAQCACLAGVAAAQGGWSPLARFERPDPAGEEGGLWALMDREEVRLRRSPLRLRDDALLAWLGETACRMAGAHCPDVRVYVMRTPYFNASMAPNGMMQVWSGLLLRMDNEAQMAAIVAHELGLRVIDTVCISSYDHVTQRELQILKGISEDTAKLGAIAGKGLLIVDDLVDSGNTARVIRELLPMAHFATVYAKPLGRPLVDTFLTEVSQDTWIFFPWEKRTPS